MSELNDQFRGTVNSEIEYEEKLFNMLLEKGAKSSNMVAWYPHKYDTQMGHEGVAGSVRGGWCRWFHCQVGSENQPDSIASPEDDVEYAANALTYFYAMTKLAVRLQKKYDKQLDDNLTLAEKAAEAESKHAEAVELIDLVSNFINVAELRNKAFDYRDKYKNN